MPNKKPLSPEQLSLDTDGPSEFRPHVKKRIPQKTVVKIILASIFFIAVVTYLIWDAVSRGPITRFLTDADQLAATVQSAGIFGPILYILLQILQTVVAPIPGQVVGSIGGLLFGPWGILWTTIGTLIGCYIVFRLARRFGRTLVQKLFKKSAIDKFDFIISSKYAAVILFLIFLLPGFPDDIICYIAGLTSIPIRNLMFILILGRIPLIIFTNFFGMGIGHADLRVIAVLAILGVIIFGISVWQRDRITNFLKKLSKKEPAKKKKDKK